MIMSFWCIGCQFIKRFLLRLLWSLDCLVGGFPFLNLIDMAEIAIKLFKTVRLADTFVQIN